MSICLDQYVMTKENLNRLNPGSNKDSYKTCNYFRKHINSEVMSNLEDVDIRASHTLNPKPIVNVLSGCCNIKNNATGVNLQTLNSRSDISSQVFNISNIDDLNKVLNERKTEYMLNWSNVKGVLDSITQKSFYSRDDSLSKPNLIKMKTDILFLLRDIISIEEDIDKVDIMNKKLNMDANKTKKTYEQTNKNYKNEKDLIKEFREKKEESKNQKLQYYDKQNFIWYNNVFYISLIIISCLFIRNQIRSK
tara:strand:- start:44 stop:793 length:750 start_codon:yes stop_codon:yes gene_type:complete